MSVALLDGYLLALAHESVQQPLSQPVPSNEADYLAHNSWRRLGWRNARRHMRYRLSGQARWLKQSINPRWRRGLWLYQGVPQIGDALMDLAPRSLLHAQGLELDLLTHPHLAELFQADPWFNRVMASLKQDADYDFVILPSHKHRSLSAKRGPLAHLPWLSMHGFYTGPEFQRAQFATQRVADWLGLRLDESAFAWHAQQKLGASASPRPALGAKTQVALALGGVDPLRTYPHWPQVALALLQGGVREISLFGSDNGQPAAQHLLARVGAAAQVHNHVGRTTLTACRQLLCDQHALVSGDGGLMHMGLALGLPVVGLFNAAVQAQWRLPASALPYALQSQMPGLDTLAPQRVADTLLSLLATPPTPSPLP